MREIVLEIISYQVFLRRVVLIDVFHCKRHRNDSMRPLAFHFKWGTSVYKKREYIIKNKILVRISCFIFFYDPILFGLRFGSPPPQFSSWCCSLPLVKRPSPNFWEKFNMYISPQGLGTISTCSPRSPRPYGTFYHDPICPSRAHGRSHGDRMYTSPVCENTIFPIQFIRRV